MNKTTLNSQKEKHSMLSLRRATSVALPGLRLHLDFYPRSPCGERQLILPVKFTAWAFLSTLSLRRATVLLNSSTIAMIFLSTLSLRRATIAFSFQGVQFLLFLSTLSLRRATGYNVITHGNVGDFYPRSPCGERHDTYAKVLRVNISIHALLAESDVTVLGIQHRVGISIHALLAESDPIGVYVFIMQGNFYPRSPCGERQQTAYFFYVRKSISIHALLAESDIQKPSPP